MEFDYGSKKPDGQHERHPVNLEGEAVRPYRDTYTHTCGVATKVPVGVAETYQKNPTFYGSTFCCGCREYYPIAQFKWKDGVTLGE
jgi:hypothetical protein